MCFTTGLIRYGINNLKHSQPLMRFSRQPLMRPSAATCRNRFTVKRMQMALVSGNTFRWNQGITGPAADIASALSHRVHVSAGPGTGKTTAIMRRVARLLEEGVDPKRVLMVTFTRAAAADLHKSLQELQIDGHNEVSVGTLHSFCMSVLMKNDVLRMTGRIPRPLLDFEKRVMMEDLKTTGRGVRDCNRLVKAFEAGWARIQSDDPGWPHDTSEQVFQRDMLNWLQFHQAMLLEEIISQTRSYLRDNPLSQERKAYDHIIVDEYQDLNRADQDFIDLLAANADLIIVGDEDQAIYSGLRFAQPESMKDFVNRHDGVDTRSLDLCRRCPAKVVKMANSLIANNTRVQGHELQLDPARGDGDVEVFQWPSMEQEAAGLAEIIEERISGGQVAPSDVLVLVPRRVQAYSIYDALSQLGIVSHTFFYEEALDTQLAKERYTLLSLLVNPHDRVSLRCWLGLESTTYLAGSYKKLRAYATEHDLSPDEVLRQIQIGTAPIPRPTALVKRMNELESALADLVGLTGEALIDVVFPANQDLRQLRRAALDTLNAADARLDASELFHGTRDRIIYPEPPPNDDYVRIMSLHKSKGLAANLVVVASCVEGWTPTLKDNLASSEEQRQIEEQRRLFYVAITRSRESLILSSFRSAPLDIAHRQRLKKGRISGGRATTIASRFLRELGPAAPLPQGGVRRS